MGHQHDLVATDRPARADACRETNLDPNPGPPRKSPVTEEQKTEKARVWAKAHRARVKAVLEESLAGR